MDQTYLNLRKEIRTGEVADLVARELHVPSYEVFPNFRNHCWDVHVGDRSGEKVISVDLYPDSVGRTIVTSFNGLKIRDKKEVFENMLNSLEFSATSD